MLPTDSPLPICRFKSVYSVYVYGTSREPRNVEVS